MNPIKLLALFGIVIVASWRKVKARIVDILSFIVNKYLLWRYPIYSQGEGPRRAIPTVPYRFPDGQGDVAKFLEGETNSRLWGLKHGTVYRIWSGMNAEIVLTTYDDVKTVFKDSDKHVKGLANDSGWLMSELLGRCLGLISGVEWQHVRACMGASFTHNNIATKIPHLESAIRQHFSVLHAEARLDNGLLSPATDLRLLPFWVVAHHLYGTLTDELRLELEALLPIREELFTRIIKGGLTRFSWSQHLPTRSCRRLKEFRKRWKALNDGIYRACKSVHLDVPMVHMYRATENGLMSWDNLYQTLDEMLFANLDVTIGSLSWNLMYLAAYPDMQAELRAEMIRAKGGGSAAWEEYLRSSSTMLAASILESARLKPLAPFTVAQAAGTSRTVGGGYNVPAGTNYVVDTYSLNTKDPIWGKDGQEYRPSRFLDLKMTELRYRFWRFGFGPRQCLGSYAAELIIRLVLVHLLEGYNLGMARDTTWDRDLNSWTLMPATVIACQRLGAS